MEKLHSTTGYSSIYFREILLFSFLLLMLEKALQEANAQLEREFFAEVIRIAIVFQQRGDDIAQSQMRQLEYSVTQGNHLRHESNHMIR